MVVRYNDRWDPFRDLVSIQGELNRLFGRTYGGAGTDVSGGGASWMPPIDVYEQKDRFVVVVELPGIEPDGVEVSVEDSTLSIRGERRFYDEVDDDAFHRVERRYGQFSRALTLPPTADPNAIQAAFDKGVLTVAVPKAEQAKPKKISIKASG
jgi:HSP20 family protein